MALLSLLCHTDENQWACLAFIATSPSSHFCSDGPHPLLEATCCTLLLHPRHRPPFSLLSTPEYVTCSLSVLRLRSPTPLSWLDGAHSPADSLRWDNRYGLLCLKCYFSGLDAWTTYVSLSHTFFDSAAPSLPHFIYWFQDVWCQSNSPALSFLWFFFFCLEAVGIFFISGV